VTRRTTVESASWTAVFTPDAVAHGRQFLGGALCLDIARSTMTKRTIFATTTCFFASAGMPNEDRILPDGAIAGGDPARIR